MRLFLMALLVPAVLGAASSSASALVRVDVDLNSQTMRVRAAGGESHVWPISSGRAGYATPRGVFRPRGMYTMVHSAKYDNAPMPHSIFFYGQYAIHGTGAVGSLGRPVSHGCVRLSPGSAARLFAMVGQEGAIIRISGSAPTAVARTRPRPARPVAVAPEARTGTLFDWLLEPRGR